ncbi:MAG: hypothetical protein IAX21_03055 [Candidatus Bathyarchaeota archaeon]|nr:hypothetical protein [Candidatus Bathyarchaeum tardum]WNZ29852.1 MAG: hypothetical protein IAX21_03055 [Candidatus Bathyarchaeota archaeon]
MASWTDWKLSDILWGIFIPVIVAFLIIIFPTELANILAEVDPSLSLNAIFVDGLGQAILTVAIPLFAGLIWNQWAGGGAGFLLGSIYALFVNDVYSVMAATMGIGMSGMGMVGDISTLGYVVSAMLVGYMAGALNKGSYSFRRMVVAAMIAAFVAAGFELWTGLISPLGMVTDPLYSGALIVLPKVIYAVIIPIFVTLFGWFGISPKQMM